MERRSKGLWYNCDEPYEGHQCQRLFYLESANYIDYGSQSDIMDAAAPPKDTIAKNDESMAAAQPTVSLHALAGIRMDNTMRLPVSIHGCCLVALLDFGSTHNHCSTDTVASRRVGVRYRVRQRHAIDTSLIRIGRVSADSTIKINIFNRQYSMDTTSMHLRR